MKIHNETEAGIFDHALPSRIPESQGDQADQAQEQIEMSLLEQIRRARQGLPPAARIHRPDYDSN